MEPLHEDVVQYHAATAARLGVMGVKSGQSIERREAKDKVGASLRRMRSTVSNCSTTNLVRVRVRVRVRIRVTVKHGH